MSRIRQPVKVADRPQGSWEMDELQRDLEALERGGRMAATEHATVVEMDRGRRVEVVTDEGVVHIWRRKVGDDIEWRRYSGGLETIFVAGVPAHRDLFDLALRWAETLPEGEG